MSSDWSFTPVIKGSLFRLTHNLSSNTTGYRGLIAQCYDFGALTVDQVSLYQIQKIYAKTQRDIVQLIDPVDLYNRQIAVRRLDKHLNAWSVSIEVFTRPDYTNHNDINEESLTVESSGQTEFNLSKTPEFPQFTWLFVNGIKSAYGTDYTVEANVLTWLSSIVLDTSDTLEVVYQNYA